ncbi:hypothetical protein ABT390_13620 [Streptomyces aurantiacus]|uniref:Uncharacterized protein n=1 Tax=Streptomyces aurantiacus JA 4570 TaxID=1286094 RepID=S3ZCK1_9ACTN|nr:hypothetical protein [Streptomyces aurantiacus]EPH40354.1 hypothetical protein STRAU_6617 [Streptomyces aurantiacus JA 4570]
MADRVPQITPPDADEWPEPTPEQLDLVRRALAPAHSPRPRRAGQAAEGSMRRDQHVSDVEFIGPPPQHKNTKHARIAAELRQKPHVWGVVRKPASISRASSAAQAIKTGRLAAYEPAGSFEAVACTVGEGKNKEHLVYARYVGGHEVTAGGPKAVAADAAQ